MGKGEIEDLLKWKIAFVVSDSLKCPFCVDVTIKTLKSLGATDKIIDEVKKGEVSNEDEREMLSLVKEVTLKAQVCTPQLLTELRKDFSEKEIIEIISIIGLFNYINRFNNTLCILPQ